MQFRRTNRVDRRDAVSLGLHVVLLERNECVGLSDRPALEFGQGPALDLLVAAAKRQRVFALTEDYRIRPNARVPVAEIVLGRAEPSGLELIVAQRNRGGRLGGIGRELTVDLCYTNAHYSNRESVTRCCQN